MKQKQKQVILAIESAINGGSLSLLRDGVELSGWIGSASVSKAEELLVNIDAMLTSSDVSKDELGLIAVSAGPGSFTGIRIGLATALGLQNGLKIEMSSVSAMTAIAASNKLDINIAVAVPAGRHAICIQEFKNNGGVTPTSEPKTVAEEAFAVTLRTSGVNFVLHGSLCAGVDRLTTFINAGENIAKLIGIYCANHPAMATAPLFINKSF